jgi:hypothetical protein
MTQEVVRFSPNTLKSWRLSGSTNEPPATKIYGAVRYRGGGLRGWLSRFTDSAGDARTETKLG